MYIISFIISLSLYIYIYTQGPDDDAAYSPPDLENEDASNFLSMMWRAKLAVILNAGPGSATLTLIIICMIIIITDID